MGGDPPVLAHDLRNPIGAVITGIRFLLEQPELLEDPETVRSHLETVLRSAESADRLLRDLLDLARVGRGELAIERDEVRLPALARERLCQVLLNLAGNAVKVTPEGGRVELGMDVEAGAVAIRVSDTGPGIPREEQERIFDRYWHRGEDATASTGLGLAIVKEIVNRHGGRVDLESRPGEGSTFSVRLPVDAGREGGTKGPDVPA